MHMIKPVAQDGRAAVVLLVEDNIDHAFFTQEAFTRASVAVDVRHVLNGQEAMRFLRRQPPYADAPHPDLVLLDLHMPRMSGYEVMEEISRDDQLKSLAVVVLTTSCDELDVQRMYRLGCRSYLIKPVDFTSFTQAICKLADYWFGLVVLPGPAAA